MLFILRYHQGLRTTMTTFLLSLRSFFPPTPEAYAWQLRIFQYFPLVTISQWFSSYHPAGKTSLQSHFNIPGRVAWCLMEVVGPVHLLYILNTLPQQLNLSSLPLWNKIIAALYVVHYFNRAIVNPLFVAPSISPVQADVFIFACFFNWLNTACIGGWLAGYEIKVQSVETAGTLSTSLSQPSLAQQVLPYVGLAIFAVGMVSNIIAERTLWNLRREEAHRRELAEDKKEDNEKEKENKNKYSKVYVIPPAKGLFRWILYPHYAFEWLEWVGFALVGIAVFPARSFAGTTTSTPPIRLAPWLVPTAALAEKLQLPLPLPGLIFVVNNIATMLPQARRGLRWYKQRFGEKDVRGRSAAFPGIPFL